MVLGIIIPDGIGIKNYLYTRIPKLFLQNPANRIIFISSKFDESLMNSIVEPLGPQVSLVTLPAYKESITNRLLRDAITFARLKYFARKLKNPTILKAAPNASTWKGKLLNKLASCIGSISAKSYSAIEAMEKWYTSRLSMIDVTPQIKILTDYKVDTIISLHQRPMVNIPMYEAARRLAIRRTCVIYSWDNVSKARLFTPSDVYMLWSQYMFDQMRLFYPEIPKEKLHITGTPQFSFYFNADYISTREAFCEKWELPVNRPFILFTGSDQKTSPYDPYLLRDCAEAILSIPEDERPGLIFRRTPADFSGRYDWVLDKYSWIKKMDPLWLNKGTDWTTAVPTQADIENIVGLIQHCAMVINVASTMALDAATHNKPCLYLSYNPKEAREKGLPLYNTTHDEDHFKVLKGIDAVAYVEHEDALLPTIKKALVAPDTIATGRKKYLYLITNDLHLTAEESIVRLLEK
jgi:hypothetical protein